MAAEIKSQGEMCTFYSGKKSERSKCFVVVGGFPVVTVSSLFERDLRYLHWNI